MTDQAAPVDAVAPAPASESTPNSEDKGVDYWKGEAQAAFEDRDKAKGDLRATLAAFEAAKAEEADKVQKDAEASGDMKKQLELANERASGFEGQLNAAKRAQREGQILNQLTQGVPEENREAVRLLYATHAATLDDGEAAPAEVAKKADAFLRQTFAPMFQPAGTPSIGRAPNEGGKPTVDFQAKLAEINAAKRR